MQTSPQPQLDLAPPATDDPTPRGRDVRVRHAALDGPVLVRDDDYSDRLRCDHPGPVDGTVLAEALLEEAEARGRGRLMVLAGHQAASGLAAGGLEAEAVIPGFYKGERDCVVLAGWPDPERRGLADPEAVASVHAIVAQTDPTPRPRPPVETRRAELADAEAIAELMAATFDTYPTPSGHPDYVARQLADGQPFRLVEADGALVACASADLVRSARTAELTDCATDPAHRGRGLMQAILSDLMDDLRALDYPTAFTLARATIPGVNLAFHRLGFTLDGTMAQSVRIGGGIEDMNVWSRRLDA